MSTTKTRTIQEVAQSFADAFTRDNPRKVVALKDDAPEWMYAAIYEAHGDGEYMPDDWTYEACEDAALWIAEREDMEYPEDHAHEFAAAHTDIYTHDLTAWLAAHPYRAGIVDAAVEDYGIDGTVLNHIAWGQHEELCRIFNAIYNAIEAKAEG